MRVDGVEVTAGVFPDGGTKMVFTEQATFLNGFEDPDAEGGKASTLGLFDQMAASLERA